MDPDGREAFIVINRVGNQGRMSAVDDDGNRLDNAKSFDAGPGNGLDPYGKGQQVAPGLYTVTPRPVDDKNKGRPTLSNTSNWNVIRTPQGTKRTGIQHHYGTKPSHSKGCEVSPKYNEIINIIYDEYKDGGVKEFIHDIGMLDSGRG